MTDESLQILRNISLVEVMRVNGFEPERFPRGGRVKYLCPFHSDHEPSFVVDQKARDGADAPGWGCFGCGKKGYGAIALQAALMGFDHTALTAEQERKVIQRLVDEHEVDVKGVAPESPQERTKPIAPQEAEFFTTEWTVYHLRALGFTVKNATRTGEDGEQVVMKTHPQPLPVMEGSDYPQGGNATQAAEVTTPLPRREGQGDGSVPLFRCSIDREYWRGRGEVRTAQEWGEIIEREFSIYPCETFITGPVDASQGGKCSLEIHARLTYPIFAMAYDWGIKKYEPRSRTNKWTWYKKDDVTARVYGDSVAVKAIDTLGGKTAEHTEGEQGGKPWWTDVAKDRRHPLVEITGTDENKKPYIYNKMKRLVLCSGPRDAMQMWAATDAHVLWLNSETAGIKDGVVEEWLQALLVRMTQVAVNVYVCYDIDATGVAASGSIALENANVHWVRLPKEMKRPTPQPLPVRDGSDYHSKDTTDKGKQGATETSSTDTYHSGATPAPVSDNTTEKPAAKVSTPSLTGRAGGGSFKDVTDFVTHFSQIQKLFAPDLRKANPSDALMRLLKNALTMQFWIDKATTRKTRDGEEKEKNVRYVLSVANLLQFLEAKGIRSFQDERGQRAFYKLSYHNTYRYLDTTRTGNQLESVSRTEMLDWLDAHVSEEDAPFKANLVNTIFTGKGLDQRTMSTMPSTPLNEHSWGEDFDHFFFENGAVRVDKDGIRLIPYEQLPYVTNEEAIMPGRFEVVKQPWRIVINPKYEAEKRRHEEISKQCTTPSMRAAENLRWKQYEDLWKFRLIMDKPLEQMPMHFQFVYNTCRIFWEKESFGETLTATERQMQDMHFINKCHAVGYSITRFRSLARQLTVHMTDYSVTDENKASGRNGKSTYIDMMATVRPSGANIAGKSMKNINMEVLFGYVVAYLHTLVCMDEMPDNFNVEDLYNIGIRIVCRTLYKQPVTLVGEEVPKVFITSNKPFDRSAGSTKGRIYPCFTSDYYHAATDDGRWLDHAPKDDFLQKFGVSEVARNLPPHLLNELQNMLVAFAQFYLQHPNEIIIPPTEVRSLRRELYAMTKDSGLTDWLITYFEDTPDNPHIGQPIAPQEMAISLLDSEQNTVNWDNIEKAKKRIAKYLKPCLNRMGIVMDPDVVLNSASYRRNSGRRMRAWLTVLDQQGKPVEQMTKDRWRREVSTGDRVPRELSNHVFVHYFYRNRPGGIPTQPYTQGKEYEEGYVQAAAKEDPERSEE